ncbi:MAG TPA: Hpt domain-containing protein [Gemmatimonadaceae bacterium]|nr:Hpt domain-containing protein [Gemmatimonadaceae bacterium]
MTAPTPVGFLDFFVLEASDYIEQLDAQLLAGGVSEPDAEALQRAARALRGSATMAKLPAFAEMASGIERVGRALRDRSLPWDAALRGVLVATVDDCKLLLRNVRAWSASDDARARARVDELVHYAPARAATPAALPATAGHDSYLATESANIGAGLELLATRPSDRDAAGNVLGRVRALRGIASVKDHATLADVLEAAEQAAHPLELGEPTLSAERIAVLNASATLLRGVATTMRAGGTVDPAGPDIAHFAAALEAMQERETGSERVVPIADLFFKDGGPTVLEAAANPPTSPAERFRLEVVSQGEHLRRLVSDARTARDDLARERVRRGLRQALKSLRQAAESFGEQDVADFVASHNEAVVRLDGRALDSLDEVAALLAQPGGAAGSLNERLAALRLKRGDTPASVPASLATPAVITPPSTSTAVAPAPPPTPPIASPRAAAHTTPSGMMTPISGAPIIAPPAEPPRPMAPRPTPAGSASVGAMRNPTPSAGAAALGDLLDRGIRNLGTLAKTPLSSPVALSEQPPVPIDALLYRGRAAIERARQIRDAIRQKGGVADADTLSELYDLLDLALTD